MTASASPRPETRKILPIAVSILICAVPSALSLSKGVTTFSRVPALHSPEASHSPERQGAPIFQLHLFISPFDPPLKGAPLKSFFLSHPRPLEFHPHLLLDNPPTTPDDPLLCSSLIETLKTIQAVLGQANFSLAVCDPEGLALAQRFGIARTPAFLVVAAADADVSNPSRGHLAYGADPDLDQLLACAAR